MGKNNVLKEELLKESETKIVLKSFLSKINMFMGEEVAVSTLSTENDIVESLNHYTSRFEGKDSNEIVFILIRSAILSNDKNYFNEVIKSKADFGEYQDILDLVNFNYAFRKSLTRNIILQSNDTDKELYDRLDDNSKTLKNLDNLRFFESITKEKIKEAKKLKSK